MIYMLRAILIRDLYTYNGWSIWKIVCFIKFIKAGIMHIGRPKQVCIMHIGRINQISRSIYIFFPFLKVVLLVIIKQKF